MQCICLHRDTGWPTSRSEDGSTPLVLLIGKIDEKHWSAIITRRDENIRLISVRRSRDEEVELYESKEL